MFQESPIARFSKNVADGSRVACELLRLLQLSRYFGFFDDLLGAREFVVGCMSIFVSAVRGTLHSEERTLKLYAPPQSS